MAAEPFLAEIMIFAGTFAPRGWAFCNGQLMSIAQNTALFSLVGTTYGGDGVTTFALPDLRGRVAMHSGQGQGLTNRVQGERAGEENHTLLATEMPAHNHVLNASNAGGNTQTPQNNVLATDAAGGTAGYSNAAPNVVMSPQVVGSTGGSQPHNNLPPYLVLNYVIALQGIFPSRN